MHQPMVYPAERYREFVAGFAPERAGLQMPKVVRIGRLAAADQAGLAGDMAKMVAVAVATRCREGEAAFVVTRAALTIFRPHTDRVGRGLNGLFGALGRRAANLVRC